MRTLLCWSRLCVPLLLLVGGCGQNEEFGAQTRAPAPEGAPGLSQSLGQLEAGVSRAEDLSAIKRLQKAYGYYLDKGMWRDLSALFTEDAVANYPAGVYVGRDSITEHVYRNVGGVEVGEVGLGDGRLYNHINMQPVVHLDAGADTARGRWRAMAMFGRYGTGQAVWAEGVYNMRYRKVDGVWKIADLEYHAGFGAPYSEGWGANPEAEPSSRERRLPHPADRQRETVCEGFPEACIIPFDYDNPGTSDDAFVWHVPDELPPDDATDRAVKAAQLHHRATLLRDEADIENLQRIYGYYLDRAQWRQLADLFAEDATVEYAQMGVYRGAERIRDFFTLFGPEGLEDGWLFDHLQLQTLVTVAADGRSARARSREWGMTGRHEGEAFWHDGVYENRFVKEDGVWKIQSLRYYPTYITHYDAGWASDARPAPGPSETLPPDGPPTADYAIYPEAHVPAYHYPNPVTGERPVYPGEGAPARASVAAIHMDRGSFEPSPADDPQARVAEARQLLQSVKDHHEIENLENAYGYYLDKNLWDDLANLFAENGSMELAQRGIYRGRERVRDFLYTVFGDPGPVEGRLGNHLHMQPVIQVDEEGDTAQVRSRMMQQLGFGGRPSMGAAIYQNDLVREEGRWKFLATHAFNTFTAGYEGGWADNPGTRLPGPSEELPPDGPPTVRFGMFPTVYEVPYRYPNPVTGSTESVAPR